MTLPAAPVELLPAVQLRRRQTSERGAGMEAPLREGASGTGCSCLAELCGGEVLEGRRTRSLEREESGW